MLANLGRTVRICSILVLATVVSRFEMVGAANTLGAACSDNTTCTGAHEYCQMPITWLSPSCATGQCACLPCYTSDIAKPYSWDSVNQCAAIVGLNLGDACANAYYEVNLPPYAECTGSIVQCKSGFTQSGQVCVHTGAPIGGSCYTNADCYGELYCGYGLIVSSNWECQCSSSYDRYNATTGMCTTKKYGDSCNATSDCPTSGRDWDGYTYYDAACTSGACGCGASYIQTTTSFIDSMTGVISNKDICVVSDGTVNVPSGGNCTVDPIYNGDTNDVKVCSTNTVCYACPEDGISWTTGKCRQVVGTIPSPPVCYTRLTAPPPTTTTTGITTTTTMTTKTTMTTTTTKASTTGTTTALTSRSSTTTTSMPGSTTSTVAATGGSTGASVTSTPTPYSSSQCGQSVSLSCGAVTCDGWSFSTSHGQLQCLWRETKLMQYCSNVPSWVNVLPATNHFEIPCYGNFSFTIINTKYWLNGAKLSKWDGGSWVCADMSIMQQYGRRLRPNEGTGSFYCTSFTSASNFGLAANSPSPYSFFYNGTFYDVVIDANSLLKVAAQTSDPYSFYSYYVNNYDSGCTGTACCWVTDDSWVNMTVYPVYNIYTPFTLSVGSTVAPTVPASYHTEVMHNGSGLWYQWSSSLNSYRLYTGDVNEGISHCLNYFSNQVWRLDNGTLYKFANGSIFRLTKTGQPTGGALAYWDNFLRDANSDPATLGGYYYFISPYYSGVYVNTTGIYGVSFVNGVLTSKREAPPCINDDGERFGTGIVSTQCEQTPDQFDMTEYIPCNPSNSICGSGFKCKAFPSAFANMSCSMGYCLPDYDGYCSPSTTTRATTTSISTTTATSTTTVTTTPSVGRGTSKYGSNCDQNWNCYTGICLNHVCSCNNCTKVLAAIEYNWEDEEFQYNEHCIPNNSTVAGLGQPCNMWSDVKNIYCGTGMMCLKCPDAWTSRMTNATCVAVTVPQQASSVACPSTVTCGYKASCVMIGDTPTCMCSSGYNLEPNLRDCYGWKPQTTGACSVTCGNGVASVTQTCDKNATSSVTCEGSATTTVRCYGGSACPLPSNVTAAAVLFQVQTQVITPQIFNEMIAAILQALLVSILNAQCLADKTIFQNQCCPGKAYSPTTLAPDCVNSVNGVTFLNAYSDGTTFGVYIVATGDKGSVCCSNSSALTSGRKKRATSEGAFDSSSLQSILSNQTQTLTQPFKSIDSKAVVTVPGQSSGGSGTTVSTSSVQSSGFPIWGIGVAAGGGGLIIIVAVVIVVVMLKKRKSANSKVAADTTYQGAGARRGMSPVGNAPQQVGYGASQQAVAENPYAHAGYEQQAVDQAYYNQQLYGNQGSNNNAYGGHYNYEDPAHQYPPYYGQYPGTENANPQHVAPQPAYGM